MRPLARFVLALSIGLASEVLFAQDPAPQGGVAAAPVPVPVSDESADPEATLTAPSDEMPSEEPAPAAEVEAAPETREGPAETMTPTPGPPVSQSADDVERPLPAPPPDVQVAVGPVDNGELGPSGRKSDWFFLAVLAVAVAVIATKLLHTRSERVSIHEDRRLGELS